ncbi:MAG TPA: M56 family metallopeptidase [Gemmatimonadales bacterium]|nr:M56 family metallopeptidase [Gemmatimonadales bacterium]
MTTSSLEPLISGVAGVIPAVVMLVKMTCVLLAALAATQLMPKAPAGARHLVWLVSVAALLLLPAVARWAPLRLPLLPSTMASASGIAEVTTPLSAPAASVSGASLQGEQPPKSLPPASTVASSPSAWSIGTWLLAIWGAVAAALLLRLLYGAWSVRRIVRRGLPLEHPNWQTPLYEIADRMELEGAPHLLQSDEVKMPFAAGLFETWIVLPAESEGWSAERRSAVLIHELGHVRRRDLIGHTLGRIASALYWFHPLVWTAARNLRAESERACDDLALVYGARPSDYAEHLLDIVTCVRDHNTPAVALAMAHRKEFEGRMLAILNPDLRRRALGKFQAATLAGSLGVLALLVGAAAPVARASTPAATVERHSDAAAPIVLQQDTARPPVAPPAAPAGKSRFEQPAKPAQAAGPKATRTDEQTADDRANALARTLRSDSSARVRRVAAWGLQRYAETDVGESALIAALGTDTDTDVREMSAWALSGARRSTIAGAALTKAIRADKSPKVRATAVWAAGVNGDDASLDALVGVLADPDPDVREVAAWAIGNCRPDKAPAVLVKGLKDSESRVRLTTAWALYNIRDPQSADAIEQAFGHEVDPEVQRGLIRALGAMGDRSVDLLEKLVTSSDPQIREVAVTALAGGQATGPWPWPWPQPRPFP